jgi:hypothetical protein
MLGVRAIKDGGFKGPDSKNPPPRMCEDFYQRAFRGGVGFVRFEKFGQ